MTTTNGGGVDPPQRPEEEEDEEDAAAGSSCRVTATNGHHHQQQLVVSGELEGGGGGGREKEDDELKRKWAAIERLPTADRLRLSLLSSTRGGGSNGDVSEGGGGAASSELEVVDVRGLGAAERRAVVQRLVADVKHDHVRMLRKQRERMERVGVRPPTVEVRWRDVCVEAECQVVSGKPLPTLWNTALSRFSLLAAKLGFSHHQSKVQILEIVSGIIKPSRITLLLGPPGCGKTTLLKALTGRLNKSLKETGEIEYNGVKLDQFVPAKTSAYVSQYDLHVADMTVRETLDFSARFQGVGSRAEIMKEVIKKEKEAGITPDPDIDAYMKAISMEGLQRSMQTDYIMKIMGLDKCADVKVGNAMRRGISGGEMKRLTTGEMIVGPCKVLLMDEISTGLDSSTTFQIVSCLQQLAHISEYTILVSLLQPAPETYDLFDDIILMGEGKVVYHGPKNLIMTFFESCGFKCPERKGPADFLQEVLSKKDQQQYWSRSEQWYNFITVDQFCDKFKASQVGQSLAEDLSKLYEKSKANKNALSCSIYSLSKWHLLKACFDRELLLMKRNAFLHITKAVQLGLLAIITGTVFFRTHKNFDIVSANYYMGSLFYALILLMVNGIPELVMSISRLPVFYKHRDHYLYPGWAYAIPAFILKIPASLVAALSWTSISYYLIGYTPEAPRYFRQLLVLFLVHTGALSLYRCVGSYCQTIAVGPIAATMSLLVILLFGGFLIPRPPGASQAIISNDKIRICHGRDQEKSKDIKIGMRRMALPFTPLTISFRDVNYYVDTPPEMRKKGYMGRKLQLLRNITGAFQPGILSALMGVTGAGKTTLLDVLAGRKTGGVIEGDIRIGGYPKVQQTFSRISGYCEQNDVHSPQITVGESVAYSAWLRLPAEIDTKTRKEFVDEVLEIIELDEIRDALVGTPGLMLIKRGGELIYAGPLGQHSCKVIQYFQSIPGVPKIKDNYNPSTWMLEVTSTSMEAQLGVDFAQIYTGSSICKDKDELIKGFSMPPPGTSDLHFPTRFPQKFLEQFKACLWKQFLSHWRTPSYNLVRIVFMAFSSIIFGVLYWQQGNIRHINDQQGLFTILGCMYGITIFTGINNSQSAMPFVAVERSVMYRERFAGMYSPWAYSFAQVAMEIPYVLMLALLFMLIAYPTIGYAWTAAKFCWFFYTMFWTLLYFVYFGMLIVSITPNLQVASIYASSFYMTQHLLSGFVVPPSQIPKWWIWLYYISPMSWTLNLLFTTQFGFEDSSNILVFGETKPIAAFVRDYFGFHRELLPLSAIILAAYPVLFAILYGYSISRFNFQKR
uniref:ABC transporter domain-containing protein n=1 Tax=Oryza glumipatula TaxID=40148 RepID=A0A0E0BQU7_9ORYZ